MGDGDDRSSEPNLTPEADDVVILAQPAANPPTPASNTPAVIVDVESQHADRRPVDASVP